jgi:putative DNA primase/helicase
MGVNLSQLAKALGGDLNGKWINLRGPKHGSADRSLGFTFDKTAPDGIRVNSFAYDDPDLCRKHIKGLLALIAADGPLAFECDLNTPDETKNAQIRALAIWEAAKPVPGTPVETYLAARCCPITPAVLSNDVIRFNATCPFGQSSVPAMIALVRDVRTGEPIGIHRTALKDDGADKRIMPVGLSSKMAMGRLKGGAVMLHTADSHLGIAEGIETALSAQRIFEMPVWATLSASGVQNFPVLHGTELLGVFADHDEPGLRAALKCAARYNEAGVRVEIRYPEFAGQDWNDFALAKGKK